jgi:peptidyl-prolyl cis-trans isomerase SDCCAG10
MNDFEVDRNDRPIFPPKIINTEILFNPFDDIVPRILPKKNDNTKKEQTTAETQKKGVKYFEIFFSLFLSLSLS